MDYFKSPRSHLVLSIKIDSTTSIERNITQEARPVAAPREHREGNGDWHVDTHLSDLDVHLELAGRGAALREDGRAVAVLVRIDDRDGVVECVGGDHDEDGTEYLFAVNLRANVREKGLDTRKTMDEPVTAHVGCCLDDRGADPVTVWVIRDLESSTVQDDLTALLFGRGNETCYPGL